jgi:hypothetical protein
MDDSLPESGIFLRLATAQHRRLSGFVKTKIGVNKSYLSDIIKATYVVNLAYGGSV